MFVSTICNPPLIAVVTMPALTTILGIGLALLSITLLVVMRTRWGQAKPLSKCVALSVLAHVLLIGYAHTTNLLVQPMVMVTEEPHQVTFITIDQPSNETPAQQQDKPWEGNQQSEVIQTIDLQPDRLQSVDSPQMEKRINHITPSKPIDPIIDLISDNVTEMALPTTATHVVQATENQSLPAFKTETPQALKPQTTEPIDPEIPVPERVLSQSAKHRLVRDLTTTNKSEALLQEMPDIQQLSDAASTTEQSDTVAINDESLRNSLPVNGQQVDLPQIDAEEQAPTHNGASQVVASTKTTRLLVTGAPLPDAYRLRVDDQRTAVALQHGGDEQTEAAVDMALRWLARGQSEGGRWDASRHGAGAETEVAGHHRSGAGAHADSGITGLVLLTFLAGGHTHLEGTYRTNVQNGLEYLLRIQAADGNLAGDAQTYAAMYCHGMASLALGEAYAMTGDPRIKPYLEKAIRFTIRSQHSGGGWRYRPGDRGDMSQFGWQLMALRSAQLSGIRVPDATHDRMQRFIRSVSLGASGGLASYRPGERAKPSMTAEALVCRLLSGSPSDDPAVDEAADYILKHLPGEEKPNLYYWYYATIGLHQLQDDRWQEWNDALKVRLLNSQRTTTGLAGSWNPDSVWGPYGGRFYSTALATLSLEAYYRFLPFQQQPAKATNIAKQPSRNSIR